MIFLHRSTSASSRSSGQWSETVEPPSPWNSPATRVAIFGVRRETGCPAGVGEVDPVAIQEGLIVVRAPAIAHRTPPSTGRPNKRGCVIHLHTPVGKPAGSMDHRRSEGVIHQNEPPFSPAKRGTRCLVLIDGAVDRADRTMCCPCESRNARRRAPTAIEDAGSGRCIPSSSGIRLVPDGGSLGGIQHPR